MFSSMKSQMFLSAYGSLPIYTNRFDESKTFGKLKSRDNVKRRENSSECTREDRKAGVRKMRCEKYIHRNEKHWIHSATPAPVWGLSCPFSVDYAESIPQS